MRSRLIADRGGSGWAGAPLPLGVITCGVAFVGAMFVSSPARAQEFEYAPAGDLVAGSGQGLSDDQVYAPGMRFPMEAAPAYANSQVWGVGGSQGPAGGQCDIGNFSYPWHDNYCETRSWNMPLCPAGTGHQGQDIRAATCDKDTHWVVSTADGVITNIGSYSVYVTAADGTRFDFLHMSNVQVSVGQQVAKGQKLGMVSNEFNGTPTTVHMHFNIRQNVDGIGDIYVPPYGSLVQSYTALIGGPVGPALGALTSVGCKGIEGWTAADGVDGAIDARLYFDGEPGDGATVGHPVLANLNSEAACDVVEACDHGFRVGIPLSLMDGESHQLSAFSTNVNGATSAELEDSPGAFECVWQPTTGLLRPVDVDSYTNWRFSAFWDEVEVTSAQLKEFQDGASIGEFPELVIVGDDLWLIDGDVRREVESSEILTAWELDAAFAEVWDADELSAIEEGAPLRDRPTLLRAPDGEVYLLDDPYNAPIEDGRFTLERPSRDIGDEATDSGCGCSAVGSRGEGGQSPLRFASTALLGLGLLALRSRRRTEK